jgi:acyl-CoA synthetase (NDP forming)/RimJ/RimL family protein N-acetyltransferase
MSTYHLDALFRPGSVLVLGTAAPGAAAAQLLENLQHSLPAERRPLVGEPRPGWNVTAKAAPWPHAGLAVLLDPSWLGVETVERLARCGVQAVLLHTEAAVPEAFAQAARRCGLRLLGPRSAGLSGAEGLNLTSFGCRILPGKMALICQSQSIAAAALDWAHGRGLGFSWAAVTGAETDVDAADLLDQAALDPAARAVVLQLSHIGDGRKFMSAARACARGKPVVVLQTSPRGEVGPDPVWSAAFQRAGLVECGSLAGLFDALAALERLPTARGCEVIVAGNGSGVCALGVEAALRQGLKPVGLGEAERQSLLRLAPDARLLPDAVDLGALDEAALSAALHLLLEARGEPPVLYIRAPLPGPSHECMARAVAAAAPGPRLLTIWLGLDSALSARRISAAAGIATFTSPDAAARALKYRWEAVRTQELLTRTPPAGASCPASCRRIATQLQRWTAAGRLEVHGAPAAEVLEAYGLPARAAHPGGSCLRLRVSRHAELGTHLAITHITASGSLTAYGFPPLDPLLAGRMLQDAGIGAGAADEACAPEAFVVGLERLSRLVLEQPALAAADFELEAGPDGTPGILADSLRLTLEAHPQPERRRLVLAPYPAGLEHGLMLKDGRQFLVRPVRPSDEPAILRLLERTDPEAIRLRFFHVMRHFSHAMAARMTQIDYDRELSLVAAPAAAPAEIAAVATLVREGDGRRAEFAVLVHQDQAHAGLGRHLMQELLAHGRRSGIAEIHGDVLSENLPMRGLARELGFSDRPDPEDRNCRKVEVTLEPER